MRVSRLKLFAEYLCGIDPPLMTYDVERSCYVSTVTPLFAADDRQSRDASDVDMKVYSSSLYWAVISADLPVTCKTN